MRLQKSAISLTSVLCLGGVVAAQGPREIFPIESTSVLSAGAPMIMGPLKCGPDEAIYLRVVENPEDTRLAPVLRVSPDGKQVTRFSVCIPEPSER